MNENHLEKDLTRFAAIVREYHRQSKAVPMDSYGARDATAMVRRTIDYRDACDTLRDEIGAARMEAARDEYDERQFRACEAKEDRWIESHYR